MSMNEQEFNAEEGDLDSSVVSAELAASTLKAIQSARKSGRLAIIAAGAFILNCAAVYPFLYGHSLHRYWAAGKNLIVLCELRLPVTIGCLGWAVIDRIYLYKITRILEER
jgi:hypothetical protein